MSKEIKLPEISEDVETATVAEILVSEGDKIERSQPVIVVDSDKATVEVPSEEEGVVESINVKVDDEIKVGDVIITLKENGAASGEDKEQAEKSSGESEAQKEKEDETAELSEEEEADEDKQEDRSGEKEKEKEDKQEAATAEKDTDKDDEQEIKESEIKSSTEEEKVTSRQDEEPDEEPEEKQKNKKEAGKEEEEEGSEEDYADVSEEDISAAPNVWRLARELGINLEEVKGTGRQGRIMEQDVKAHAKELIKHREGTPVSKTSALPDFSRWGDIDEKPLKGIRKATAENTARSWNTIPHVTHFDRAEISEIEDLIESKKHLAEKKDATLSITAVLVKIIAEALKEFPKINATIDMERKMIIQKKYIHVGVAVDTEKGLLVPVIRDVDKKDIIAISIELTEIAKKTREGKLSPGEMKGGSFTISNVGGIGGTNFTPIIPFSQTAILGVSKAEQQPVWEEGAFKPKLMLPLALSYDHRVIDGADAARFTRWICEVIENPLNLLIE